MKTFNNEDLRKFKPCYDPTKYLKDNDNHTILTILDHNEIPFQDKLWVIFRNDFVSDKLMRLFAVWSYRQTLAFISNPDKRSIECANIAEKFANGLATQEELSAAESAAWSARSAARSAAWSAESARSAAWSARSAAWSAAESAESAWSAA